jgi:hypothetical protein
MRRTPAMVPAKVNSFYLHEYLDKRRNASFDFANDSSVPLTWAGKIIGYERSWGLFGPKTKTSPNSLYNKLAFSGF